MMKAAMVVAVALAAAVGHQACAFADAEPAFISLGERVGGQRGCLALGVSADGRVVVGLARSAAGDRAFRWHDNAMTDLGQFSGGSTASAAHACSVDGSIIVGNATMSSAGGGDAGLQRTVAFLWRNGEFAALPGLPDDLTFSDAWDVNADGSAVVGQLRHGQEIRAFLWRNGRVAELPALSDGFVPVAAYAVSADGAVAAGDAEGPGGLQGFRWSDGRSTGLGTLSTGPGASSVRGMSADGRIIVGQAASEFGDEAFRWEDDVITGLGGLSDDHEFFSMAGATSADGSIIVGSSESNTGGLVAFIWDRTHGMRSLQDVLVHELGLNLAGWTLTEATGISADGSTIIGVGHDPLGQDAGWLARLGESKNPRPESIIGPGESAFGQASATIETLAAPGGVCIDRNGTIFLADTDHDCVRVFNRDGVEQGRWTRAPGGGGDSQLSAPRGIACSADGMIFVADSGNDRVVALTAAGEAVRAFGRSGRGAGELHDPHGVVVHGSRLFVADTGNDRIVLFDVQNNSAQSWGRLGDQPGEFRAPAGVAIDDDGNLFVADSGNNRIQKLNAKGEVLAVFGEHGRASGMFCDPQGLTVVGMQLHVADTGNHRIQVFDLDGGQRYVWGMRAMRPHEAGGRLHYPNALAIAPDGAFAAVCEWREDRCQIFNAPARRPGEAVVVSYVPPPPPLDYFGAAMDIDGHIMAVTKPDRGGVDLLDLSTSPAQVIATIGDYGGRAGQMRAPAGVMLDVRSSQLIVADAGNHRLQLFQLDPDIDRWPRPASSNPPRRARLSLAVDLTDLRHALRPDCLHATIIPGRIERDPHGNLYVLDQGNNAVLVFDAKLTLVRMIGRDMGSEGRLREPVDFALSADGERVHVVDRAVRGIRSFDSAGRFISTMTADDAAGRVWTAPAGIAVDANGLIYVTDDSHGVFKLDEQGRVLTRWGRKGIGPGEFFKPRAVAIDESSRVVVLDWGNHRAQMFSADGQFLGAFGAPMYVRPAIAATTANQ